MRLPPAFAILLALAAPAAGCGGSGAGGVAPARSAVLHTLSGVDAPALTVTRAAQGTAPGLVFIAEKKGGRKGGPLIVDNRGRIVWYLQLEAPLEATDFRPQRYRGRPVLTWWQGRINKAGVGQGEYVIYDDSYRQVATVRAGHGLDGDLHEFQLTPRGTALITAYKELPADLTAVGGPKDSWVLDSIVQEIDVASGRVVFEWHSIGHVPLRESMQANREPARHASRKRPFDYFHVNSVAEAPDGNLVISARNTSTVYEVARAGHIVWRLGGKRSDFGPPAAVRFAFQHDARLHPGGLLSLFDNGAIPKVEPYSRPLELKLDVSQRRARVVKAFVHPHKLLSPFEGSLELLPGGDVFVGWGGIRRVSEFGPHGGLRFELKLPYGDTYRGYRFPWSGHPADRPAAAMSGANVYASWNGRTGIARWQVLGGDDAEHLAAIGDAPWTGLETAMRVKKVPRVVAVRALDADGHGLGTSVAIDTG